MYVVGERKGILLRNRQAPVAYAQPSVWLCYVNKSPVDILECRDIKLQLLRVAGSMKLPDLDIGWINTCKLHVASHSCH